MSILEPPQTEAPRSAELIALYENACGLAERSEQELQSLHLLLAIFLQPNKAEVLLREREVNEERLLLGLPRNFEEPSEAVDSIVSMSRALAARFHAAEEDTLHLLMAICRTYSQAQMSLRTCLGDISPLRNQLNLYLSGNVKRRFDASTSPEMYDGGSQTHLSAPPSRASYISPGNHYFSAPPSHYSVPPTHHPTPPNPSTISSVRHNTPPPASHGGQIREALKTLVAGRLPEDVFPNLTQYGRNLTEQAYAGRFDPLIGRSREIVEMIDVLGKRRANNPCLVGEPGVGKTAIVQGLACHLIADESEELSSKVIIELDMGRLIAGTQMRGSLAEKLKGIKEEVCEARGQIIVFIDEIHTLVRAGAVGEGAQDASNDLKSVLSRGEFPCIGATTIHEYRTYIERDPALLRRFHTIWVEEPSEEETLQILQGLLRTYSIHHQVHFTAPSLQSAVRLSSRYMHDRRLPAKALDVLDMAASRARRQGTKTVDRPQVVEVIANISAIPKEHLLVEDRERFLRMEEELSEKVIGHFPILKEIASVIRRNYAGFRGQRPIGSFLFLGPTGVGKTEMAKALAQFLFHDHRSMVRIDMSEFQDAVSVNRLIGAPPGYVGHDEGGQLTEAVRLRPYQLVLFDEIDKSHPDVLTLLLQMLDEGHLTDGKGRRVVFSNCVIVMTSNIGSECFTAKRQGIGFGKHEEPQLAIEKAVLDVAQRQLRPELWNRIEGRFVFHPLQSAEVRLVARLLIKQGAERLRLDRDISYVVTDDVLDWLIAKGGYDPAYGARPMRRVIERYLEASLAEEILRGRVQNGDRLEAHVDESGDLGWSLLNASMMLPPSKMKTPKDPVPSLSSAPPDESAEAMDYNPSDESGAWEDDPLMHIFQ
ncbi:MAG: ATP-dependent Clp protease ATP-binding subunit [Myxococcales bacterium]|nr:ATP-dependent Clp protease ATP-binding subunit [Myxococcales bacterium]